MRAVVEFLLLQWKMRGIDEEYLKAKVEKGSITQKESEYIQSTEQITK